MLVSRAAGAWLSRCSTQRLRPPGAGAEVRERDESGKVWSWPEGGSTDFEDDEAGEQEAPSGGARRRASRQQRRQQVETQPFPAEALNAARLGAVMQAAEEAGLPLPPALRAAAARAGGAASAGAGSFGMSRAMSSSSSASSSSSRGSASAGKGGTAAAGHSTALHVYPFGIDGSSIAGGLPDECLQLGLWQCLMALPGSPSLGVWESGAAPRHPACHTLLSRPIKARQFCLFMFILIVDFVTCFLLASQMSPSRLAWAAAWWLPSGCRMPTLCWRCAARSRQVSRSAVARCLGLGSLRRQRVGYLDKQQFAHRGVEQQAGGKNEGGQDAHRFCVAPSSESLANEHF